MIVLAFDTATPETVAGLWLDAAATVLERRHTPAEGERPGHTSQLLALIQELLDEAGITAADVERIGVGVGPGTFTGLRIGVATARGLAQATGAELAAIGTLDALALGAAAEQPLLTALDARRGEAFAATYTASGERTSGPLALGPAALAELVAAAPTPLLAVGDGALRFRDQIEHAGATVPADDSPLHRVSPAVLCRMASAAEPTDRDALAPEYVRPPDAKERASR